MNLERIIPLAIGTVLMIIVMVICRRWIKIPIWKIPIINIVLTVSGTFGAYLLYYIENGRWSGISFYGSILLIPACFIFVSLLIRMKNGELMDACAPAVCAMLALNKVKCLTTGCCKGMVLHVGADGVEKRFPSQLVEMIVAIVLMLILIVFIAKGAFRDLVYPVFLILYGVTRFGLNLLRETTPFVWKLPAGNFWSIVAVLIAIAWIVFYRLINKGNNTDPVAESSVEDSVSENTDTKEE